MLNHRSDRARGATLDHTPRASLSEWTARAAVMPFFKKSNSSVSISNHEANTQTQKRTSGKMHARLRWPVPASFRVLSNRSCNPIAFSDVGMAFALCRCASRYISRNLSGGTRNEEICSAISKSNSVYIGSCSHAGTNAQEVEVWSKGSNRRDDRWRCCVGSFDRRS